LTFRFDKWWHLSKAIHIGENSQILTVSNKKRIFAFLKNGRSNWSKPDYTGCFRSWGAPCNMRYVLYIIVKHFSLNLLSKMFVLTGIIDCIFLLFYKILSPVLSIFVMIKPFRLIRWQLWQYFWLRSMLIWIFFVNSNLWQIRANLRTGFKNFKKINLLYLHCRRHFTKVILAKTLYNNAYYYMLKGTPYLRKHPI
jgi:hypothetical protein